MTSYLYLQGLRIDSLNFETHVYSHIYMSICHSGFCDRIKSVKMPIQVSSLVRNNVTAAIL